MIQSTGNVWTRASGRVEPSEFVVVEVILNFSFSYKGVGFYFFSLYLSLLSIFTKEIMSMLTSALLM